MSTALTTNQNTLPTAFQGAKVASIFANQEFESGADGIEGGYGVIKYGGKVWSLQYRGNNYPFIRQDDGTPQGYIDVVVVRAGTTKAKTYYPNGFQEGSKEKPLCFSNDGVRPDPSVSTPPAKTCAVCPNNVFGSRITEAGKKAKACSDHKRNAVMLDPDWTKLALGAPLNEPVMLRIPAASLNDFAAFSKTMEAQNFPLPSFVTRITFDAAEKYPKMVFKAHRPLTEDEGPVSMLIRDDPLAIRIVSETAGYALEADAVDGNGGVDPTTGGPTPARVVGAQTSSQPSTLANGGQPAEASPPTTAAGASAATSTGENVVALNVAPRMTPQQQAAAMAAAAQSAGGGDDLNQSLDAELAELLK